MGKIKNLNWHLMSVIKLPKIVLAVIAVFYGNNYLLRNKNYHEGVFIDEPPHEA